MKIANSIGWCDETINAVTGCDKVSPGCKNCYAQVGTRARVLRGGGDKRWPDGVETWGPNGVRVPVNFEPVFRRLNKLCICEICHTTYPVERLQSEFTRCHAVRQHLTLGALGECEGGLRRIRLFADSNSDWLDAKWPIETLAKFLDAIRLAPNIDVILLTKRIEHFPKRIMEVCHWLVNTSPSPPESWRYDMASFLSLWRGQEDKNGKLDGRGPANVWVGVSVESQKYADDRIPKLIATPAAVRFLSVEPLLEAADVSDFVWKSGCNPHCGDKCSKDSDCPMEGRKDAWVIVGGESGDNRRDCGVEAIVSVHDQCVAAGVPVYVKQDVAFKSGQQGRIPGHVWRRKEFPSSAV